MVPQNPQGSEVAEDPVKVVRMTELQYVDAMGKTTSVPSKNIVEIRVIEDVLSGVRFEICYDNGDYSQVQAQAMHILRSGRDPMDALPQAAVSQGPSRAGGGQTSLLLSLR
jgi:hypothetical protein